MFTTVGNIRIFIRGSFHRAPYTNIPFVISLDYRADDTTTTTARPAFSSVASRSAALAPPPGRPEMAGATVQSALSSPVPNACSTVYRAEPQNAVDSRAASPPLLSRPPLALSLAEAGGGGAVISTAG